MRSLGRQVADTARKKPFRNWKLLRALMAFSAFAVTAPLPAQTTDLSELEKRVQSAKKAQEERRQQDARKAAVKERQLVESEPAKMKDLGGGVLLQSARNLKWTKADNGQNIDWQRARLYCANLSLGGLSWRLPTAAELGAIYANSESAMCVRSVCHVSSAFVLTSYYYWVDALGDGAGRARYLLLTRDESGQDDVGNSTDFRALCVAG